MNLKTSKSKHMSRHQYRELHSRGLIVPKFARCARPPHR
jgi:hypothetical protein